MGLNVKIDLKNAYSIVLEAKQQQASVFNTILTSGQKIRLGVQIAHTPHPLIPNAYNLVFGPIKANGRIDDKARLSHQDHSRVFSTVLLEAMAYLKEHPNDCVGIDGSNNARAYLYYRCIQNNYTYLTSIFNITGINYYIRMLREGKDGTCDLDTEDIITKSRLIEAAETAKPEKLYNYFIFSLKSDNIFI
jgi:hypothetical protein